MINISEIRTELFGLIGFKQPYNPDYAILDSALLASSSGMYFDQFSGYVTVENIKEIQPYSAISNSDFNTWLTDRVKDSITRAVQQCFTNDDLVENRLLFDKSTRKNIELENNQDFVGYEIEVTKRKDIKAVINKIIAEFSGAGDVKILLFNDNLNSPLQNQTITIDANNVQQEVNWDMVYANTVSGGKFYIGYLTNGLVPKAYNRIYEDSNLQNCYNHIRIEPIKISDWTSETLFDINNIEYVSETWGLNFDISSYRDYTSLVINNQRKFTNVIGYQFAADMLGMMYTSTRTNGIERLQKGNLLLELQGNFDNPELPTFKGVIKKLEEAIEDVKKQLVEPPEVMKETLK